MVLISDAILEDIKKDLKENHSELYLNAFLNLNARHELREVLRKEHKTLLNTEEKVDYVIQETVGLGVIDEILNKNPNVTDISFNGTQLIIETPEDKFPYSGQVDENYIIKIIQKFANAVGKEFTPKSPILDAAFGNLRLNAVHKVNSPYGTSMAIRVTRPRLALNEENFVNFAPRYMFDFFKAAIETKSNIVISGETGTGKTELQKFLVSFIPFEQKIDLIEDTLESHMKELFPDKDITSWLATGGVTFTDLIRAALRNNPTWILVSETRGKEAYEMIQAVLTGHKIITTVHAVNAAAIPSRFVNMAKMGYQVDEKSLKEDIYRYFQFGVHIKKKRINGKMVRYLSEVVEYLEGGKINKIFEAQEINDEFIYKSYDYSEDFAKRLLEHGSKYQGIPKME